MPILRRQLPPLNALRAFEVAGRKLNFRAAADELGVTQGAVAQQVRALEDHLGLALFLRQSRGLALTPTGAAYLGPVSRAFDTLTKATDQLLEHPARITISVTPTVAAKLLIPRLAEFNAQFPNLELRTIASEALVDFGRDQVDLAIRLTHAPLPAELEARLLFTQELIAVASPHLIQNCPLPLTLDDLGRFPLLQDAHGNWARYLDSPHDLQGAAFNQTSLAIDAALAGQGIALACRAFVAADLAAGRLIQVAGHSLVVEPSYFLIRKRGHSVHGVVDDVWNWCLRHLSF